MIIHVFIKKFVELGLRNQLLKTEGSLALGLINLDTLGETVNDESVHRCLMFCHVMGPIHARIGFL